MARNPQSPKAAEEALSLFSRSRLPLLTVIFPDDVTPVLPASLSPRRLAFLANAYRHSQNPAIPFRCDFIEKLVPLLLSKNPPFFGGLL